MNEEQVRARIAELENGIRTQTADMNAIVERCQNENRDATDGESERTGNLFTSIERKRAELRGLEAGLRAMTGGKGGESGDGAAGAAAATARASGADTGRSAGPFNHQAREAFGVLRSARHLGDELRDAVAGMVERDVESPLTAMYVSAAADPAYARAFGKLCRDPINGHRNWTTEEASAYQRAEYTLRALNLSTGAAMLPTHLDANVLLSGNGTVSPFREIARVETGITQTFNAVASEGVTTEWTAEGAEVGDGSPSFASPTATAFKATSFVPISFEALGDMALDGVGGAGVTHAGSSELTRLFNDERRNHEASAFVSGNGTTQPRGLITALDANTNSEVANTTSNVFGSVDVYNLIENLPARYRPSASWAANLSILNQIDQFETGNGAKLFPQAGAENPVILRRRAYEVSEMDGAISAGGTDNILVVGDFQHYLIYDRVPSQLELIPHLFGTTNGRPTGQRGFLYWWRVGANSLVDNAFRVLQAETNA